MHEKDGVIKNEVPKFEEVDFIFRSWLFIDDIKNEVESIIDKINPEELPEKIYSKLDKKNKNFLEAIENFEKVEFSSFDSQEVAQEDVVKREEELRALRDDIKQIVESVKVWEDAEAVESVESVFGGKVTELKSKSSPKILKRQDPISDERSDEVDDTGRLTLDDIDFDEVEDVTSKNKIDGEEDLVPGEKAFAVSIDKIEGIDALSEAEISAFEGIYESVKKEFEEIDKDDQKKVDEFWKNVLDKMVSQNGSSTEYSMKEEYGIDDRGSIEKIVNVLKINLESSYGVDVDTAVNNENDDKDGRVEVLREITDDQAISIAKAILKKDEVPELGSEELKEQLRKSWKEFVVHGKTEADPVTGEVKFKKYSDLDGNMCLHLLKSAGLDITNVEYVPQGHYEKGKTNLDTGNRDIEILDDGTVILDHHSDQSSSDVSAAARTYDLLLKLGLLEQTDARDRTVQFVTQVDNFNYPDADRFFKKENYFTKSHCTLLGMWRGLQHVKEIHRIENFFKRKTHKSNKPLSPAMPLSEKLMREFKFIRENNKKFTVDKSKEQKRRVDASWDGLKELQEKGCIINTKRYGKVCINIGNRVPAGGDAVRAFGCDTFLICPDGSHGGFFISSTVGRPLEDSFDQGVGVRGTMWVNIPNPEGLPGMTLGSILDKITDKNWKPAKGLRRFLETEKKISEKESKFSEKEKLIVRVYLENARYMLARIDQTAYEEKCGIDKKDVAKTKTSLKKKCWKELRDSIMEEQSFDTGKASEIIVLIKDKIKHKL